MMKNLLIAFSSLALVVWAAHHWVGCTSNPTIPSETDIVLRGYLYAQEPVSDIQITMTNSLGSSDSTYPPITTASVVLIKEDVRYGLNADPTRPGYYAFTGNGLSVNTDDIFHIEVSYGGRLVTAQTVVPPKPEGMAMSTSMVHFTKDSIQTPMGVRTMTGSDDTVLVTWSNASQDYYYIVIESVDSRGTLIRDTTAGPFGGGGGGFGFRLISQPTNQSSYRINPGEIQYTGKHIVKLYRVNKEYADLYRSRMQDSRALNEPLTNVADGLGIFSAFSSESREFMVTLDQ
jgi:hypothetical protein